MKNDCANHQSCGSPCDGEWWCRELYGSAKEVPPVMRDDSNVIQLVPVLAPYPVVTLSLPKLALVA